MLEIDAITHVYQLAQGETFYALHSSWRMRKPCTSSGSSPPAGSPTPFSHTEYLRPKVSYSEGLSGSWVESLNSGFSQPYVVITDMRAYSAISRQYCRVATERCIPLALITDVVPMGQGLFH